MPRPTRRTGSQMTVESPSVKLLPHGLGIDINQYDSSSPNSAVHVATHIHETRCEKLAKQTADENAGDVLIDEQSSGNGKKTRTGALKAKTLGVSPYPDLAHPTEEEAQIVHRLLTEAHGKVEPPPDIPVPSRSVAGCGEVKFTLEALVRTMISAHTSMGNAGKAIAGLCKRYRVFADGLTEGCVDWDQVRREGRDELAKAIQRGGMQNTKARDIHAVLEKVFEENQSMKAGLLVEGAQVLRRVPSSDVSNEVEDQRRSGLELAEEAKLTALNKEFDSVTKGSEASPMRAEIMTDLAEKVLTSGQALLTLDYMHSWPVDQAFAHLQTFRGVGVKTAACVLLFCMQRPFYAVDTHVWRISRWLGWTPEKASRDQVFAHCDARVPADLKYPLHQLLIVHGKVCLRCRSASSESSPGWEDAQCCLEHLVRRTGGRKSGEHGAQKPPQKRGRQQESELEDVTAAAVSENAASDEDHPAKSSKAHGAKVKKGKEPTNVGRLQGRPASTVRSRAKRTSGIAHADETEAEQIAAGESGDISVAKLRRSRRKGAEARAELEEGEFGPQEPEKRRTRAKRIKPPITSNHIAFVFGDAYAGGQPGSAET